MIYSLLRKILVLCLFGCSFARLSSSEIDDVHHFFSPEEKSLLEERIQRIKNEHDVGLFVFPYMIVEEKASINETLNIIFEEFKKVVKEPTDVRAYNFVYYGRGSDANDWSLFLIPINLELNGKKNDPETIEKMRNIYNKVSADFSNNGIVTISGAVNRNVYLIEQFLSSEGFQIPPEPTNIFGFELSGWSFFLLMINILAVVKDLFFVFLFLGLLFFVIKWVWGKLCLKKENREL